MLPITLLSLENAVGKQTGELCLVEEWTEVIDSLDSLWVVMMRKDQ